MFYDPLNNGYFGDDRTTFGAWERARDSLQLGKYRPIPMVLILSSVMLLITEILSPIGQLSGHGREQEIHYSWVSMGPFL